MQKHASPIAIIIAVIVLVLVLLVLHHSMLLSGKENSKLQIQQTQIQQPIPDLRLSGQFKVIDVRVSINDYGQGVVSGFFANQVVFDNNHYRFSVKAARPSPLHQGDIIMFKPIIENGEIRTDKNGNILYCYYLVGREIIKPNVFPPN